ncbi:short chain dehydrogenase/reductase family oxidoreductase, putative [Cordyceps militaris CM01]|uniref:Short chain dehydrogenase/reductase family oxidoreductase, putative n=1 Tax=Cordyceps militaris (strain CM01) TaxID=983644 RepID=G3JII8_CORMM|nr:short chain dehydrogenase/reductase family oxidoreductase, putative [Cordyceps militaris CM01]EGX91089.1 short chain dehydrogenase/reductase family oxidoreductase, putative [Cordyceps militaris CM01]
MPTFQSKKFRSAGESNAMGARYRAVMSKRPFLMFGLPFLAVIIAGSFVLTPATAIRYERHDRRVRQMTRDEELNVRRSARKVDMREEYYRLAGGKDLDNWEQKRVERLPGESDGINFAFAQLLLGKGCNVVLADIKLRPKAEELVSQHSAAGEGPRAVFVKTDVTAWEDLRGMLDTAVAEFGGFDIVCPGAGVFEPLTSSFWHPPGSDTSWDFVDANHYTSLDINLTHPIRTTQLALQHWLAPENAARQTPETPKRVVTIASIAGYMPVFPSPLYVAAKYGVVGFTRSMAPLEAAVGIRVSAVAPGAVRTPMLLEHPDRDNVIDDGEDVLISVQKVAEAMLLLVESEDHPGGTILEVSAKGTRPVSVWNDPGPSQEPRQGTTMSKMGVATENVVATLTDGTWQKK